MKYLVIMSMFLVGCANTDLSRVNSNIERETFTIMNNGVYAVSVQTDKRTSKSLLQSRLINEIQRTCSKHLILNKEYHKQDEFRTMQITFKCFKRRQK